MKQLMATVVVVTLVGFLAVPLGVVWAFGKADTGTLGSCGGGQLTMPSKAEAAPGTEYMMTVQATSKKSIPTVDLEVTAGREFSVNLASNATTGYRWELAGPLNESIVKVVRSTYQAPDARLLGAGGQEEWTFKAVGPGQAIIPLRYLRPWEKGVEPADAVNYRVTVR